MASLVVATILVAGVLMPPYNYANARTHYIGVIDEPNGHKISKIIINIQAEVENRINQEIRSHGVGGPFGHGGDDVPSELGQGLGSNNQIARIG